MGTAYSATIGGLSTLVGTAPNVLVKGFVERYIERTETASICLYLLSTYKGTAFRLNFLNFFLFGLPVAVIMLILCWVWLQLFFNRHEFGLFTFIYSSFAFEHEFKILPMANRFTHT